MSIIYECVNKSDRNEFSKIGVEQLPEETTDNTPLSTNLERMRMKIKKLMKDDKDKCLYSNVARYLIGYDKEGDSDEELSIDEIRAKSQQLLETMESELVEYMKKEIQSLGFKVDKYIDVDIDNVDVMNLGSNVAFIVNVDMNTVKFETFVDQLAELYDKLSIVKCGVDDCYTERVVIILGERNEVNSISDSFPVHQEEMINFLYAVYSNAIFVLSSNKAEYKKIVECSVKLINSVKLF